MANSRNKGSKNERELSKWWQDWSGLEFSRVPASGGLRWKKTDNISGDIICTDPRHSRRFPFTIEGKFYKDINFEHLILGVKNIRILEFWEQAKGDGERSNRIPLLFMRYDRMPKRTWFVVMSKKVFDIFNKSNPGIQQNTYFIIHTLSEQLVCMNSDDLLISNYKEFTKTIKTKKRNGRI